MDDMLVCVVAQQWLARSPARPVVEGLNSGRGGFEKITKLPSQFKLGTWKKTVGSVFGHGVFVHVHKVFLAMNKTFVGNLKLPEQINNICINTAFKIQNVRAHNKNM